MPLNDSPEQLLAEFAQRHFGRPIDPGALSPICQGASGRFIARLTLPGIQCIAIYWTDDRPDNMAFIPVARMLHQAGMRVPGILASQDMGNSGMALVQDLGDVNLLSFKAASWDEKRGYYASALEQVHRIHHLDFPENPGFQPPFDESLYRWEQEYFAEHFITHYIKGDAASFLSHPACIRLAAELAGLPRTPIHRDFQSQNIHIIDGETWLIDFQGMRMGLPEYDLASLIYDPYAGLSPLERDELCSIWEDICNAPLDRDLLAKCALQRIMQALGAFARYSNAGNAWYEEHVNPAAKTLFEISTTSLLAEPLGKVVECFIHCR